MKKLPPLLLHVYNPIGGGGGKISLFTPFPSISKEVCSLVSVGRRGGKGGFFPPSPGIARTMSIIYLEPPSPFHRPGRTFANATVDRNQEILLKVMDSPELETFC